jgi:hypothetical protein
MNGLPRNVHIPTNCGHQKIATLKNNSSLTQDTRTAQVTKHSNKKYVIIVCLICQIASNDFSCVPWMLSFLVSAPCSQLAGLPATATPQCQPERYWRSRGRCNQALPLPWLPRGGWWSHQSHACLQAGGGMQATGSWSGKDNREREGEGGCWDN